uniref:Uncharacterized protein n=1 Tax=Helianthus annuus TaxID=4232 RepID=A0A251UKI5_HELAN
MYPTLRLHLLKQPNIRQVWRGLGWRHCSTYGEGGIHKGILKTRSVVQITGLMSERFGLLAVIGTYVKENSIKVQLETVV